MGDLGFYCRQYKDLGEPLSTRYLRVVFYVYLLIFAVEVCLVLFYWIVLSRHKMPKKYGLFRELQLLYIFLLIWKVLYLMEYSFQSEISDLIFHTFILASLIAQFSVSITAIVLRSRRFNATDHSVIELSS